MATHTIGAVSRGRWPRVRSVLVHEFREMLPPTIFFFVGFNLIVFSKRLFLADYLIQFSGFFLATILALVVGKTVLIGVNRTAVVVRNCSVPDGEDAQATEDQHRRDEVVASDNEW